MKALLPSAARITAMSASVAAVLVTLCASANAQTEPSATTLSGSELTALAMADSSAPAPDPDAKTTAERVAHLSAILRHKWEVAVAALPTFCLDWERMLRDREADNLSHLQWKDSQGFKTATYTGYGKVLACRAKESEEGVPLGKVTYEEKNYYLVGKTPDEAKSHPKLLNTINTLEIFSWEKDRWFY